MYLRKIIKRGNSLTNEEFKKTFNKLVCYLGFYFKQDLFNNTGQESQGYLFICFVCFTCFVSSSHCIHYSILHNPCVIDLFSSLSPVLKSSRMDKELKMLISETLPSFVVVDRSGESFVISSEFAQ